MLTMKDSHNISNSEESLCSNEYDWEQKQKKPENNFINPWSMTRCPLSPVIFNLCFDYVIIGCKDNDFLQTNILTTILFADEQVMVTVTEDSLKKTTAWVT